MKRKAMIEISVDGLGPARLKWVAHGYWDCGVVTDVICYGPSEKIVRKMARVALEAAGYQVVRR
jgi:hypothetical protein